MRPILAVVIALVLGVASAGAGRLGSGDEQLGSGEYFDRVTFVGAVGDVVLIELTSADFDPYLILIDGREQVLAQEDDTPGMGLGARITFTLTAAGTYTVIVTSALPGETGGYSLLISTPEQIAKAPATTPAVPGPSTPGPSTPGPSTPGPSTPGPSTPGAQPVGQPRSVTGTVVDTLGRPIEGALVTIVPSLTTGQFRTITDANGRYLVEGLVDVPYNAYAWAYVAYRGRQLCLRLGMASQADYTTFVPLQGAERNFMMRFDGFIGTERNVDRQFGGTLYPHYAYMYGGDGNQIEVSFTPTGPIIDGTTGAPFVRTIDPELHDRVSNVPPGPYTITLTLVGRDGSRRPLRFAPDYGLDPVESLAVDWTGNGVCDYGSGLERTNIYLEWPEF